MSTKKPSELEMQRAVRYLRHVENCRKCSGAPQGECEVAMAQNLSWVNIYYKEVKGTCKHFCEGECWDDHCRGGKKAR